MQRRRLFRKLGCKCPPASMSRPIGFKFYDSLFQGLQNAGYAAMMSGPLAGVSAFHNTVTNNL